MSLRVISRAHDMRPTFGRPFQAAGVSQPRPWIAHRSGGRGRRPVASRRCRGFGQKRALSADPTPASSRDETAWPEHRDGKQCASREPARVFGECPDSGIGRQKCALDAGVSSCAVTRPET